MQRGGGGRGRGQGKGRDIDCVEKALVGYHLCNQLMLPNLAKSQFLIHQMGKIRGGTVHFYNGLII